MQPPSPAVTHGNKSYNINNPSGSLLTINRNYSHMCACAAYTSHGYYSRAIFISSRASDCAATLWRQLLFECGVYSKKYSITFLRGQGWGRNHLKFIAEVQCWSISEPVPIVVIAVMPSLHTDSCCSLMVMSWWSDLPKWWTVSRSSSKYLKSTTWSYLG